MKLKTLFVQGFLLLIFISHFSNAQVFVNPSVEVWGLTGSCEINTPPDNWTNYSNGGSGPDEANFSICPTTIPPNASDGNVYARMYTGEDSSGEGMFQIISGFVAGDTYHITFDYAGSNLYGGSNDVQWHLFIDDSDVDQTPVFHSYDANWSTHTISFIATSASHKIGVRLFTTPYPSSSGSGAIDNFTLNPDSSIFFIPVSNLVASDSSLCEKFCISFTDQSINNPASWQWIFPGGDPSSSTDQNPTNICYDVPGVYDVTLITTNAYGTDTLTMYNYITVYPVPPFPTITQIGYTLTSSLSNSYQWQLNAVDIPGATNQSYTVTQSGLYTVIVGDSNGCKNSLSIKVTISGIRDVLGDENISIFPNPASDEITIEATSIQTNEAITISIINVLGEIVQQQKVKWKDRATLDVKNLPSGIYLVRVENEKEKFAVQFVKE